MECLSFFSIARRNRGVQCCARRVPKFRKAGVTLAKSKDILRASHLRHGLQKGIKPNKVFPKTSAPARVLSFKGLLLIDKMHFNALFASLVAVACAMGAVGVPVDAPKPPKPEVVAKLAKAVPGASAAKIAQAAQVVSSTGGSSSSKKKKAPHTISGPSRKQILINFGSGVIPPTSQADVMSSINATFRSHNRSIRMHGGANAYNSWTLLTTEVLTDADLEIVRGWVLHYYRIPPNAWTDATRLIVSLPMSTSYLKLVGVPFYKHGLTVVLEVDLYPDLDASAAYTAVTALRKRKKFLNWSEGDSRNTLASCCLVNHAWYKAAKPWLWHRYAENPLLRVFFSDWNIGPEVRLPRTSLSLVEQLAWNYDGESVDNVMGKSFNAAANIAMASAASEIEKEETRRLSESFFEIDNVAAVDSPEDPISMLSLMSFREPSPRRLRPKSKSPARWKIVLSISDAIQTALDQRSLGLYVPSSNDPLPDAIVQAELKELSNPTALGAMEYMVGALTLPVLNEMFLRGAPSGQSRCRNLMDDDDVDEEDKERRRECKDLDRLQIIWRRSISRDALSILPPFLGPFVLSFHHLTHLDLSGTRITSEILDSLGAPATSRLKSLALARCIKLSNDSIRRFLVDSPVTSELTELNLDGDMTDVSPLTVNDLHAIMTESAALTSGNLVYLDMSSVPFTKENFDVAKPFPKLRSFGLSHIPRLGLKAISQFVKQKAKNVEILTLISTSPSWTVPPLARLPFPTTRISSVRYASAMHPTFYIQPHVSICSSASTNMFARHQAF
ncbi:hypothetical protein NMY22_g17762 [Coprinellus aureogranulatus]|nr:hypothetical protein NMY22_g17762 [Coprinellus aureogranulatus]